MVRFAARWRFRDQPVARRCALLLLCHAHAHATISRYAARRWDSNGAGPAVNYRAHARGGLRLDAADCRSSAGRAPETTIAARVTRWDKEGESRCERTRESADMPAGGRRRLFFFYLSLDPTTGSPGPGQRARNWRCLKQQRFIWIDNCSNVYEPLLVAVVSGAIHSGGIAPSG